MRQLPRHVFRAAPALLAVQMASSRPLTYKYSRGFSYNCRNEPALHAATKAAASQASAPRAPVPSDVLGRARNVGVFVAGLEGTMHHLWESVFVACEFVGRCVFPNSNMQHADLNLRSDQPALNQAWAGQAKAMGDASLIFVNHACGSVLSYPSYKPGQFPELNNYADAAVANGDRLKVIVMLRDADDMFNSVNRAWGRQAKDVVDAAQEMLRQLTLFVGTYPDSLICVDTGDLPGAAREVNEFLGRPDMSKPAFNFTLAVHERYNPKQPSTCRRSKKKCKEDAGVRAAVGEIRKFCDTHARGHVESSEL